MTLVPALHRHRHSPRVRRRARDWGVELEDVVGTGPAGRVTEEDLRRALEAAPAPPAASSGVVASARLAVGDGYAADRNRLVAATLVAAVAALRRAGRAVTSGGVTRDGVTRALADVHDLTADGVLRRLAPAGDGAAEVRVVDATGLDALTVAPVAGEVAVVAVGDVREELVLDRRSARLTLVWQPFVSVTVATAPGVPESVSGALVDGVRRQLEPA